MTSDKVLGNESLNTLIAIAESALKSESEDQFIDILEQYSEKFARWQQQIPAEIEQNKALLEKLQTLHSEILARAQTLKGGTAAQMRQLKKRGKGILAYTDVMPKRLGAIRPRKG